jgi:hypothetical protein
MLAGTGLRVYGYWKERQHGLSNDMATKITVQFYADAREALLKALGD